jgi:hypothetical protein
METNLEYGPDSDVVSHHRTEWAALGEGQKVLFRQAGHPAVPAVIDTLTPDASVLWLLVEGQAPPRKMFLARDPVEIRVGYSSNPKAF